MKMTKKLKELAIICGALCFYCLLLFVSGVGCPLRFLFGIPCPGCGMTSALFSAITFNFTNAFSYHPLWFTVPIGAVTLMFFYLYDKKKPLGITAVILAVLFVITYIIRLILGDEVVQANFDEGVLGKLLSLILGALRLI